MSKLESPKAEITKYFTTPLCTVCFYSIVYNAFLLKLSAPSTMNRENSDTDSRSGDEFLDPRYLTTTIVPVTSPSPSPALVSSPPSIASTWRSVASVSHSAASVTPIPIGSFKQDNFPRVVKCQYVTVVVFQVNYLDEVFQRMIEEEKLQKETRSTNMSWRCNKELRSNAPVAIGPPARTWPKIGSWPRVLLMANVVANIVEDVEIILSVGDGWDTNDQCHPWTMNNLVQTIMTREWIMVNLAQIWACQVQANDGGRES